MIGSLIWEHLSCLLHLDIKNNIICYKQLCTEMFALLFTLGKFAKSFIIYKLLLYPLISVSLKDGATGSYKHGLWSRRGWLRTRSSSTWCVTMARASFSSYVNLRR